MKAAVYDHYGDANVVLIRDVDRPEIEDNEILVKVYAAAISTADWRFRASAFPGAFWLAGRLISGLFGPRNKILGTDFAGRIVGKGATVTQFKGGDAVFGFSGRGAHAEYVAVKASGAVALKPDNLTFGDAAAVPFGALTALVFLRDFAKLKPGSHVLVNSASGGVGVYAVQLAKMFGARVTAVAGTRNLDLMRALGADEVIDYTQQRVDQLDEKVDIFFDTAGRARYTIARKALKQDGLYVPLEFGLRAVIQSMLAPLLGRPKIHIGVSGDTQADMVTLATLLASGDVRPVIDSRYPLDAIVDGHRKVESRHKTGSVVIDIASETAVSVAAE